ncbi:uncharacterized protein LOC106534350, partial [Austrofundulus limnaeus]|uniref:Uncharacterized protein LOC106534350 n=1 Tax=Austrofundulus limnaeus TaxID=52670 RepID=A0A2I4D2F6_AUSLI
MDHKASGEVTRHLQRLNKLQAHHNACEKRYEEANSKRRIEEKEKTTILHRQITQDAPVPGDELEATEQQPAQKQGMKRAASKANERQDTSKFMAKEESTEGIEDAPVPGDEPGIAKQKPARKRSVKRAASKTPERWDTSKQLLREEQSEGGAKKTRRMWSKLEVDAVEKTLMSFIKSGKMPGKADCETCIAADTEALSER